MTAAPQTTSFIDGMPARGIALLIAVLIAALLWVNYSSDFKELLSGNRSIVTLPTVASSEPAKPANPALEQCLMRRVGDVDQMKADGILSDAQYASFKARAEELCRAQNPGS